MAESKESVNLMGAAAYLLGWITGVIFLVLERNNKFVRFHAMQSIVLNAVVFVVSMFIWLIPLVNVLFGMGVLVLWIVLMFKAFQGEMFRVPKVADLADTLLAKLGK